MKAQTRDFTLTDLSEQQPNLWWIQGGKLGNHFMQFSATYCTAQKTYRTATILNSSDLLIICPNISAKRVTKSEINIVKQSSILIGETSANEFNKDLVNDVLKNNQTIVKGSFQSWKYFHDCEAEIRSELQFNNTINNSVKSYMLDIAVLHSKVHLINVSQILFIGVHVRRGPDKLKVAAPISFINNAMTMFRKTVPYPVFFVASDDMQWCKENIHDTYQSVYFSQYEDKYMYDFVLLSSCNHSIITIGTFGWFSAWLTGGKVVYYGGVFKNDEKKRSDHFPSNWISMM